MDAFERLVDRFPLLRRNIASILERHLNELEIRYREVSTEKVSSRLSNLLVRLVSQVGRRIEDRPVTQGISPIDRHDAVHRQPPALPMGGTRNRERETRSGIGA
jgi:CRP-like cAMP-binding protein